MAKIAGFEITKRKLQVGAVLAVVVGAYALTHKEDKGSVPPPGISHSAAATLPSGYEDCPAAGGDFSAYLEYDCTKPNIAFDNQGPDSIQEVGGPTVPLREHLGRLMILGATYNVFSTYHKVGIELVHKAG